MSGKQTYFGKVKKIDSRAQRKTLSELYDEADDPTDLASKPEIIEKPEKTEKVKQKTEQKKPEKAPKKPKREHHIFRIILIILLVLAIAGVTALILFGMGRRDTALGDIDSTTTEADEIFYSRLTGVEVADKETANRPATCIMIENSPDARPQSGLGDAGIVYEALAEGGITRFMAIFQEAQPQYIGPVRSVRMAYAELAKPYHCSIAHVGGSDNAVKLIRNNSAFRDIDQFFNGNYYWRESTRYAPHNVYTSFEKLDALNQNKGYTSSEFSGFTRIKPDTQPEQTEKTAKSIKIAMSSDLFSPVYTYNEETQKYARAHANGGAHYSVTRDGQLTQNAPDVVIAMKVNSYNRPGTPYADYTTTGSGEAYIFQAGGVIEGHWNRENADSELRFVDNNGEDIPLVRGQVWISLYPSNGKVTWE